MIQQMDCVVLRTIKHTDSLWVVDVFSRQVGRTSLWLRVPRGKHASRHLNLFSPMAFLDIQVEGHGNSGVGYVRGAQPMIMLSSIPYDARKLSIAFFLAEFLYHALRTSGPDMQMFDYLQNSVQWLDGCNGSHFANFHLVFLIRMLRFMGVYPNNDNFLPDGYFDMQNATFTKTQPTSGVYLPPDVAVYVPVLLRMRYESMHLFRMSRDERNRCLQLILLYYNLHFPGISNLKSVDVLRELFD